MTTTTTLHPSIASDELLDGLARFAAVEVFTEAEARRVDEAARQLVEADRGNPCQRAIAAQNLGACRFLAERSGPAKLDAEGLNSVRAAIAAALRFMSDRAEYAPPDDPRSAPKRLHPADRQTLEGQARLRLALASVRRETDVWALSPERFDLAAVRALLGRASDGCRAADQFRATFAAPAPVPVSKPRHRK
jgi:hypothetical protein